MRMRSFMLRFGAVTLFCALFFGVWQPIRTVLATKVVHPLVRIATDEPTEAVTSPPSVRVTLVDREVAYSIPGGIHLLIPGLLLVALAPRKPYWLVLWVTLLGMGLILLFLFFLGLAGFGTSFVIGDFIRGYVVPPVSLGLALLLLSQNRRQTTPGQHDVAS